MACQHCHEYSRRIEIASPDTLEAITRRVHESVESGLFRVVRGSYDWSDLVECDLACTHCGQRFRLRCETYRGQGGRWSKIR